MTSSRETASNPNHRAFTWAWLWLLPPLLVLLSSSIQAVNQYFDQQWLTTYRQKLTAIDQELTPQRQTQLFYENSTTSGILEWLELNRILSAAFSLPTLSLWSSAQWSDSTLAPSALDLEEADAERLLADLRPLDERLDVLLRSPSPIWVPRAFSDASTGYMSEIDLSGIRRYIELELLLHVKQADRPGTLRSFEKLDRLEVVEMHYSFTSRVYSFMYLHATRLRLLAACLTVPGWNDEELRRLRELTRPSAEISDLWRKDEWQMRNQIAEQTWYFLSQEVDLPLVGPYMNLTFVRASLLRRQSLVNVEPSWKDPEKLARALAEIDANGQSTALEYEFRWQRKWLEVVSHERFVNTGLAIRQFKLRFGVWPNQLSELTKIGLRPADWRAPNGFDFGYRAPTSTDNSVVIWFSRSPALQTDKTARFNPKIEPAESYDYGHLLISDEIKDSVQ